MLFEILAKYTTFVTAKKHHVFSGYLNKSVVLLRL